MRNLFTLIILVLGLNASAQKGNPKLVIAADSLSKIMKAASLEIDFDKKQDLVEQFSLEFIDALKQPYAFDFSFDSIPGLGSLVSQDKRVRVLTWAVPTNGNRSYSYYGAILRRRMNKENPISDVFLLEDTKGKVLVPDKEVLNYPDWFGCVYYDIVDKKDGANTVYTLMGFDFNHGISKKRYIEVLTFTNEGFPKFGAPIFVDDKGEVSTRIVFEYSMQSSFYLNYFPEKDKIVFNLLMPLTPEKEGDPRYYVADLSYDGYEFKKGKWVKVIDVKMEKKK